MTFLTSWQGLHDVLPIIIAEGSRMFLFGFYCFSGIVIITLNRLYRIRMYTLDGGDHGKLPWSGFG